MSFSFNDITWNGTSLSAATGGQAHVEHYPGRSIPEREIDTETIPGRNGDIIMIRDAWKNVDQEYEIAFGGTNTDYPMQSVSRLITKWLFPIGSNKYLKLSDTYDPGYFRLAYFKGPYDIESIFNKYGRATITFTCRPERFLDSGDTYTTRSGSSGEWTTLNGTGFTAKPMITANGSGELALVVDNDLCHTVLTISAISSTTYIDCETMNVYSLTGENLNNKVVVRSTYHDTENKDFPVFYPGDNEVSWSGSGVTQISIKPRWWTI